MSKGVRVFVGAAKLIIDIVLIDFRYVDTRHCNGIKKIKIKIKITLWQGVECI